MFGFSAWVKEMVKIVNKVDLHFVPWSEIEINFFVFTSTRYVY
jgi:hypothetical protein